MSKRYGYLIPEIVAPRNLDDAFEEVVGNLHKERKVYYEKRKESIIDFLSNSIGTGTFSIEKYQEFDVQDGPKVRKIQSPGVVDRIGCNAIMRVVEKYVYPTVIKTSAASIKGRGMHKLFRKMRSDIRNDREGTKYYYQNDICKFYHSICQIFMISCIEGYVKDKVLLPILIRFIKMMDEGLSIGLRSSQCFGNLLLSGIDHLIKEYFGVKYYYRYCDDIVILSGRKKILWRLRNILHGEIEGLNLTIKANEAIRPITEGIDFLGYVFDGEKTSLRKRTKQNAARKLAKVKSRKRRQQIIGSFKGMAKWADCSHLYYKLTHEKMIEFKDLNLHYVAADGKKRFDGQAVSLRSLINDSIDILDFENDVETENGLRTLVSFQYKDGRKAKYFTADKEQQWYLEQARKMDKIPFNATITPEYFGKGKVRYLFT